MPRKVFFAAFIIDEESYTQEPGPVDRRFVCSDLAQSSFGEQQGVSNFMVWDGIEELMAEHRQQGPITVGYLAGDGDEPTATPPDALRVAPSSFRDCLPASMRGDPAFEYYEVRPCIERGHQITSYPREDEYAAELVGAQSWGEEFRTFWCLYGIDAGAHTAIGDFVTRAAAHEVMNAILAVPAAARNAINATRPVGHALGSDVDSSAGRAADWLDDMINQSSNERRI